MNTHYKTNKLFSTQLITSECKSTLFEGKLKKAITGLMFSLVFFFGFNSVAQVATYRITETMLVNCPNNCGSGSLYGGSDPGFAWTDTLPVGAIVDSIVIRFNMGVECTNGTRPTRLNGVNANDVTTTYWCDCTVRTSDLLTSKPNPASYLPRALNNFVLTGGSTVGYCPNASSLGGAHAIVSVYYKTADIEVIDVKPVTSFTSMCKLSSYEVDLTLRNNGPGPGGTVDVEITFPGAEKLVEKVSVADLGVGQTKTYRLSKEYLIPSQLGSGLELKATVLSTDLNNSNNVLSKFWDVLTTPYGSEMIPAAGFPGFPRDGNRFNQDYITYDKTYRYDITSPAAYTNNTFNTAWTANFTALLNGAPMPASKFTYTAPNPSTGTNAFVVFNLVEEDLNSEVQLRFAVTDISGNGCDSTTIRYAIVMPTPKPLYDGISVCEVDELQFVNKSSIASGLNSYRWDFGDGNGSTLFEPKHKFGSIGSYPVKLVATSNIGFADSVTVNVEVNPSPMVDFSFTNQCGNNAIPFVNASSISNGTLSYIWEFGDGTESNQQNPNKVYNIPGPYEVTMYAESDKGCVNSITKAAYSYPAPTVNFSAPATICAGDNVLLENTTSIAFSNWGSEWIIGSSMKRTFANSPSYTFKQFGEQPIKLKVTTQFGCVDSISKMITINPGPAIDITHSDVCSSGPVTFNSGITVPQGMAVDYVWNIAGTLYAASNPTVNFGPSGTKNISVDITYANGCRNNASTQVLTGYRPNASFTTPDVVCSSLPISISNNTTIEFGTAKHTWTMGDGSVYNDVIVPNHIYTNTAPTEYTITLISSSTNGICPDTVTQNVTVGLVPVCDFNIIPTYVNGHRGYTFDPTEAGASFQWYFGDGRTSTQEEPLYQYQRDGNFPVRLVISTPEGCQCEKIVNNLVINSSTNNILESNGISVYPNPSSGLVYISNSGNHQFKSIKVMNTIGAIVIDNSVNTQMSEYTLDLSNVSTGVYMVTIETMDGQQFVQRVIVSN